MTPRRFSRLSALTALGGAALLLAGCGSSAEPVAAQSPATETSTSEPTSEPAAAPAACAPGEILDGLDTRAKLAQMLMVGVDGTDDAEHAVSAYGLGGIFIGGWTDDGILRGGMERVNAAADIPPMVSIDEEGGRVARFPQLLGHTEAPRTVGQTWTVEQTRAEAEERGAQLREFGVTVDLAPSVDVSTQPDDSVIGDRSYSDDPDEVIAYAGAFAEGMRAAGVLPVLKHFPGHGESSGDTHVGAVTVPPLDELQDRDLVPFRELIGPDTGALVGHLQVPGLTEEGLPTSLSPATMALLREGAGYGAEPFEGVIFTDDLSGMAAITDTYSIAEAVTLSLSAGVDVALWLSTEQVPEVLDELERAVDDGRLPIEQVDASVTRILTAKQFSTPCVDGVWHTEPGFDPVPGEGEAPAGPEAEGPAAEGEPAAEPAEPEAESVPQD